MKEPRTKQNTPPPKTLERRVRTVKGQNSSIAKSLDKIHNADKARNVLEQSIPDNQEQENPEAYAADNVMQKGEYTTRKIGEKTSEYINKAARDKLKKTQKIRNSQSGRRSIKNAIYTGKNINKGVKASKKGVKKAQRSVKTTAKAVKRSAEVTKKTAAAAKKTASAAVKTVKVSAKAIVAAVKAIITAVKSLAAAIAAGGWVVIVIIIVVCAVIAVMASPLAVFSNETDGTTPTISEVVQDINKEYSDAITNIISSVGEIDELIIEGETSSSKFQASNWIDVIGVFSVKSTITSNDEEFIPLIYMQDKQIKELKNVFWKMNIISYEIIEEIIEPEPTVTPNVTPNPTPSSSYSSTPEPTPEIYRTLIISIDSKTYEEGAKIFNMSNEQSKVLEEMMSPDYMPMFMQICGMDSYTGLTSEQMINLINDLPVGKLGSVIVEYALSRLGDPYSQPKRGQGDYVDCSYLTRWCYQRAGVSSFTAGTAAEQARYCVDNNLCIAYSDLQPGDLIFWSFNTNGRFMNITHTGIYAGNGYVIDASSSRGMVVYRSMFGASSIVVCARPHVAN